ncbi:MAG: precorrin-8X methylmutase [Synergistaceae bacterium]|nr:precorrin-8X methylmutase [Synergistaceae bacterium]
MNPTEIEHESMRIIQNIIGSRYNGPEENLPVIKRVIHATADFDFLDNLFFSDNVITKTHEALRLRHERVIITDTLMLKSGISKNYGINIICHVNDEETHSEAKSRGLTRAIINIERCVKEFPEAIYAIGNSPTALIRLCELIHEGKAKPALVIGVPVGFVNVIESKELLLSLSDIPRIISRGNKGGSPVACAIVNAILYAMA